MRTSILIPIAYATLAVAIIALGAAGYLVWDFSGNLSARAADNAAALSQATQSQNSVRAQALVEGTVAGRTALSQLVQTDVLGIANTIQAAGNSAGAKTTIASVSSATSPAQAAAKLNGLEFIVNVQGTFAQVYRTAQLLQTLPLPSQIESLDFERNTSSDGTTNAPWQLTVRFLTITNSQLAP